MILVIYQWYLYGSNGGEHTQTTPQPTVDFRNSLHLGVLLDFFWGYTPQGYVEVPLVSRHGTKKRPL